MSIRYKLLDVFADEHFQGTQIPVVILQQPVDDALKRRIASEFRQTETVFIDTSGSAQPCSVFDETGETRFGAHTTIAAAQVAADLGFGEDVAGVRQYRINNGEQAIDTFVDPAAQGPRSVQFSTWIAPVLDAYTPEESKIAQALGIEEKHLRFSKYRPLGVSINRPTLVVPLTRHEHVLAARLQPEHWSELLSSIYADSILLFAPGSVSGTTDFHGRLMRPDFRPNEYPPIGNVMPEFVAYLASQSSTVPGTHTFSIDRGSPDSRVSVIHVELDKQPGKEICCRIGGRVILIGEGQLFIDPSAEPIRAVS